MNPYTGQTTLVQFTGPLFDLPIAERERAAAEVGLDDPDDLVLIQGTDEHVRNIAAAVKAQRRAANKRARKSRKQNR